MPHFEVKWSASGRAVIEADDRDEAEKLTAESLVDLDSSMFESIDVDETSADAEVVQHDG